MNKGSLLERKVEVILYVSRLSLYFLSSFYSLVFSLKFLVEYPEFDVSSLGCLSRILTKKLMYFCMMEIEWTCPIDLGMEKLRISDMSCCVKEQQFASCFVDDTKS